MRFLIAFAQWIARGAYAVMKAVVPVRRKVVLLSRQSDVPSRDFALLAETLRERDASLEIVVGCAMLGDSLWARLTAIPATLGQMRHLAGARACVVDGYSVPVSVLTHRRDLYVVQMWHALGAFKKFGYQALDRPGGRSSRLARAMRMHDNYDLVLCGGPATVPVFAEAFNVDAAIVRPLGLPRIDYLLAHADDAAVRPEPPVVAELHRRFPVLADPERMKVLYAPTFRRHGNPGYDDVARGLAGDRYAVMVKPHPLETAGVEGPNVADVADFDVLDLLPLCDAVVTDYSAVAFEALVLDIPVFFYVYDIDAYRLDNGLNIDPLEEFRGIASRDIDEIARWIEEPGRGAEANALLKQRYVSAASGGCTERIVDAIMERVGVDRS